MRIVLVRPGRATVRRFTVVVAAVICLERGGAGNFNVEATCQFVVRRSCVEAIPSCLIENLFLNLVKAILSD